MFAHIDADAFFASVLQRQNPRLRGKPLLALGMGGGCVIAASYEAKATGVKTGMRVSEALRLCPQAVCMPSDFRETGLASQQIEAIVQEACPVIEQMSVDEWFLDLTTCVGGSPRNAHAWAETVRTDIQKRTGLSVSVGIGSSKLLAKMASEYRKPGGITVLASFSPFATSTDHTRRSDRSAVTPPPGLNDILPIETFLRDRPAAAIPGLGRRRMPQAEANGWVTAWDVATAHPDAAQKLFGRPGRDLQRELLGEALSPVVTVAAPPKSISRARSFRPTADRDVLWAHTLQHLQYITLKMRRQGLACRGISVWLRDDQYAYRSEHASLPQPADTEDDLTVVLQRCFATLCTGKPCTQVGAALWRLQPAGMTQASLFEDPQNIQRRAALQTALDGIREKFGRKSIHRGSALPVDPGTRKKMEMPVYE